ncbi:MAG: thioredoxin 1 [Chlamydiales bacterium]|jgi:thioredoxin 1
MPGTDLIKHLNDENFSDNVAKGVTLVDFSAEWCAPCRMIVPILEQIAEDFNGKALIAKVDTDEAQKTASGFNITSVPTLILFKDGVEVNRTVGLKDEDSLKEFITAAL